MGLQQDYVISHFIFTDWAQDDAQISTSAAPSQAPEPSQTVSQHVGHPDPHSSKVKTFTGAFLVTGLAGSTDATARC